MGQATLGVLWTNVPNRRQMRLLLATAEMPNPRGSVWHKARVELELENWFGTIPDFVITLFAPHLGAVDDATFCAVIEHELYHCAQARDEFGGLRFSQSTGRPLFAIRGHDVEEFVGVVQRYGADAAGVRAIVTAGSQPALLRADLVQGACGTCLAKVA